MFSITYMFFLFHMVPLFSLCILEFYFGAWIWALKTFTYSCWIWVCLHAFLCLISNLFPWSFFEILNEMLVRFPLETHLNSIPAHSQAGTIPLSNPPYPPPPNPSPCVTPTTTILPNLSQPGQPTQSPIIPLPVSPHGYGFPPTTPYPPLCVIPHYFLVSHNFACHYQHPSPYDRPHSYHTEHHTRQPTKSPFPCFSHLCTFNLSSI